MGKTKAAPITRIETPSQAKAFADHLRSRTRRDVVAVLSTGVKESEPRLDAGAAALRLDEIGVRTYVIVTGPATKVLRDEIGEMQALFGGAVRVYPVGTAWIEDPYASPLMLGMPGVDPHALTNFLVKESQRLVRGDVEPHHEYRSSANGTGNSVGAVLAAAMEEKARSTGELLTAPSTIAPAKRTQQSAASAAAAARVAAPAAARAAAVPASPAPAARDVKPDEPTPEVAVPELVAPVIASPHRFEQPMSVEIAQQGLDAIIADLARITRERDDLADRLQSEVTRATDRGNQHLREVIERLSREHATELARIDERNAAATRTLTDRHAANIADAEVRVAAAEAAAAAAEQKYQALTGALSSAQSLGRELSKSVQEANQRAQDAEDASVLVAIPREAFEDADDALRHMIRFAWVQRVPAADKETWPLPEYSIGSRLVESIDALTKTQQAKAMRTIVDVLTGMASTVGGRAVHPLRKNDGPTSGPVTDPDTGAVCMRANIESNTASARRLHFWKNPDGSIELIRIVLHDDMTP